MAASCNDKALRDLTDGVNEMRSEVRTLGRDVNSRLERLEGRVSYLESDGVPMVALEHLKRIEARVNEEHSLREKYEEKIDSRQDALSMQLTEISTNSARTSNLLSEIRADLAKEGRVAGGKAGAAVTIVGALAAGVAYGVMQFIGG